MKQPEVPVEPGQIWADWDIRERPRSLSTSDAARFVRIVSVNTDYVRVLGCDREGQPTGTRRTTIRISRLRPTASGYKFHKQA